MAEADLDKMNKILEHLEELKKTQESMIEKIGKIEIELGEDDTKLKEELELAHKNASNNTDIIKNAIEEYTMKRNVLNMGS